MDGKLSNYDIECAISLGLVTFDNNQNSRYNKEFLESGTYAKDKTEEILKNICNNVGPEYRMYYDVQKYNNIRRKMKLLQIIFSIMLIISLSLMVIFSCVLFYYGGLGHIKNIKNENVITVSFYETLLSIASAIAMLSLIIELYFNRKYLEQMNLIVQNAHNYIEYNIKLFSQQNNLNNELNGLSSKNDIV